MKLKIALIRHGETEKAVGGSLSENGKRTIREKCEAKAYPTLKHVYTCGLACCRDTATLIYPFPAVILKELSAPGPEAFVGQASEKHMNTEEFYDASINAGSIIRKIGAEMEIKRAEQCALISHKMVLFEILRRYCVPRSSYEDWEIPFGGGYLIEYDIAEKTARILGVF